MTNNNDSTFQDLASAVREAVREIERLKADKAKLSEELRAYRDGGLTEEILRRNNGYIKVGRGCVIALASEYPPEYLRSLLAPEVEKLDRCFDGSANPGVVLELVTSVRARLQAVMESK